MCEGGGILQLDKYLGTLHLIYLIFANLLMTLISCDGLEPTVNLKMIKRDLSVEMKKY